MSQTAAFDWDKDRRTSTQAPFDLTDEMSTKVAELKIESQVGQLRDEG